jgi:hypothetical protein
MGIAAEHFPVFVARDEQDLLNRKARFEEAACAFVPEVVKVKVFDFEVTALAPTRRIFFCGSKSAHSIRLISS